MQICHEDDMILARKVVREAALEAGLGLTDVTRLVTAASELARNILQHAGQGEMECRDIADKGRHCIEIIFTDEGPGIPDVDKAMEPGFSTSRVASLGLGLPGARRLVDEMDVSSEVGKGTRVRIRKWHARKQSY